MHTQHLTGHILLDVTLSDSYQKTLLTRSCRIYSTPYTHAHSLHQLLYIQEFFRVSKS